jgi:hypothetical protein
MSAAWDAINREQYDTNRAKRALRLWGYLTVAGLFLLYVSMQLHINLF